MRDGLLIEPADAADAATLHAIQMRAFEEEGRLCGTRQLPPLTETVHEIAAHIRQHAVRVARMHGLIVGSARGLRAGLVCTLRGVSVDPTCQGRGIGAALVRAVEAAHADAARFELTTNTVVPGNVAFYERLGYRLDRTSTFGGGIVLAHLSKPGLSVPPD